MKKTSLFILISLCPVFLNCGSDKSPSQTEQNNIAVQNQSAQIPSQSGGAAESAANQPANPMAAMQAFTKAMGEVTKGNAKGIKLVPWKSLIKALPVKAAGWKIKGEPEGESVSTMGMSLSRANCKLEKGEMKAEVELIDTTMNPMLAMPFKMTRSTTIDSSKMTKGPIDFGEIPGTKEFNIKRKKAEVMAMIKDRILVKVEVKNASSDEPAVSLTRQINFKLISGLL